MRTIPTSRRQRLSSTLILGVMLTLNAAGIARAQILLRVPSESPGVPAYARVERPFLSHTD
jgi:hypothetical protein